MKEELKHIYTKGHKIIKKGVRLQGVSLNINNSEDMQRHGFRMIKNLKEQLSRIQNTYVKRLNQDIDQCKNIIAFIFLDINLKSSVHELAYTE